MAASSIRHKTKRITEALWQKVDQVGTVAVVTVRGGQSGGGGGSTGGGTGSRGH
ncbi:MAG TPA: hypothetical protein VGO67_00995 [Verrucomicrobiae bacterium]